MLHREATRTEKRSLSLFRGPPAAAKVDEAVALRQRAACAIERRGIGGFHDKAYNAALKSLPNKPLRPPPPEPAPLVA
jgi:hypothetical protein